MYFVSIENSILFPATVREDVPTLLYNSLIYDNKIEGKWTYIIEQHFSFFFFFFSFFWYLKNPVSFLAE